MKLLDGADCYGSTIFSDDIRHEVGGKISIIGAYIDRMYVHGAFPFVLPRFAMLVTCIQRVRAFKPVTKFVVFFPGEEESDTPSISADYDSTLHPDQAARAKMEDKPHGIFTARTSIVLSPLVVEKPGHILVRAVREGDEMVRCGALPIEPHPSLLAKQSAS